MDEEITMGILDTLRGFFFHNEKTLQVNEDLLLGNWDSVDWSTDNFASLSKEGYEHVSTVYRCVNLIAKTVGALLFGVFEEMDDGFELIKAHPLMATLKRPNPIQSKAMFIRYWVTCLLLGGRAFIWANVADNGEILEFWVIPPSDVNVTLGETFGTISSISWTYNGEVFNLDPAHVLYTWFPNPRDFMQPMSPLKAAAQEVDLSNQGLKWNLSLLSNYAKPPFYVGLDKDSDMALKDEHVEQIKRALRTEYSGADNAGRAPVFRIPGLSLTQYGWNPQDMDWLNGLSTQDVRIANVYDIPPEFIGQQATYENRREANFAFYDQAVLPVADLLADELTNWRILSIPEEQHIAVLREQIRALKDDQEELSNRLDKLVTNGIITRNEARLPLGYETSDDPMADVLTVGKEVTTLGVAGLNMGTEDEI
jgi:HK97 family phage portal protein